MSVVRAERSGNVTAWTKAPHFSIPSSLLEDIESTPCSLFPSHLLPAFQSTATLFQDLSSSDMSSLKVLTHWEQSHVTWSNMQMICLRIFTIYTKRNTNMRLKFTQRMKFGVFLCSVFLSVRAGLRELSQQSSPAGAAANLRSCCPPAARHALADTFC